MVSNVDNSSSNKSNEIENRNKSESSRRETELHKKHAAEVSRMQQEHYEKIKQLQDAYQTQMTEQREASKDAMTSRDIKYQQEMEEMRKMNREKIMGLTGSYEERIKRNREGTQRAMESNTKVGETQRKVLSENLIGEIQKKDKMYQEALNKNQKDQQVGMARERGNLDEKHRNELRVATNERNSTVERLQDDVRDLARSKRSQEKDFKGKIYETQKKGSDQFGYELSKERRTNADQQKMQKESFDNSLDKLQKRYGDALYEEQVRNSDNTEGFKEDVTDRQQGQLAMLERKLRDTKDTAVRHTTENKRLGDLEKQHIMEGLKNNLTSMEKTRQMALADSNDKNAQNIRDLVKRNEVVVHNQVTQNQENMSMLHVKHEDELSQTVTPLVLQNEKLKTDAQIRERQRTEINNRDRKFQDEYYAKSLSEMKKNFESSLADQRIAGIRERNQAMEKLTGQMRLNESKFEERISLTAIKHDKEMQDVKSSHNKDMELVRRNYESRIEADRKMAAQNIESQKLKYETQIAHQKESYEEKIRQMQKNIDQEKISMAKGKT